MTFTVYTKDEVDSLVANLQSQINGLSGGGGGSTSPTEICVTDAPWNAVGDGVTDDSLAINNAIASLAGTGGVVIFPAGKAFRAAINRTNMDGVILRGDGNANGAGRGAYILPIPGSDALDLSGSSGYVENLNIGSDGGKWPATTGRNGILMGQIVGKEGRCTLCHIKNVFLQGSWTGFGLLGIGIVDLDIEDSIFYQRAGTNSPVAFMRSNRFGFTSLGGSLITSPMGSGDIKFRGQCEIHDEKIDGTRSNGAALHLWDTGIVYLQDGTLVSSSSTNAAIQMHSDFGGACTVHNEGQFSSQMGGPPNYDYFGEAVTHAVWESADVPLEFAVAKVSGSVTVHSL